MSFRYTIETENPIVTDGNKMYNCNDGKLRLKIVEANPWHTGTPTEDGWYVCFTKDKDIPYQSMKFKEGWWWDFLNMVETKVSLDYVVAWQKIEPFEEAD